MGRVSKNETTYDDVGNVILVLRYRWGSTQNDWIVHRKYIYTYSETEEMYFNYEWIPSENIWIGHMKLRITFDEDGDDISFAHYSWDSDLSDWLISTKDFYYYSTGSGIEEIEVSSILCYPNPSSGIINITGLSQASEVKLYSSQGKLLKSLNQVESTIDISDLPAGIYILNLTSGNKVLQKRIIKR